MAKAKKTATAKTDKAAKAEKPQKPVTTYTAYAGSIPAAVVRDVILGLQYREAFVGTMATTHKDNKAWAERLDAILALEQALQECVKTA